MGELIGESRWTHRGAGELAVRAFLEDSVGIWALGVGPAEDLERWLGSLHEKARTFEPEGIARLAPLGDAGRRMSTVVGAAPASVLDLSQRGAGWCTLVRGAALLHLSFMEEDQTLRRLTRRLVPGDRLLVAAGPPAARRDPLPRLDDAALLARTVDRPLPDALDAVADALAAATRRAPLAVAAVDYI